MRHFDKPAEYSASLRQFSRFLVVGLSNFVISFGVFYLLYNYWKLSGLFYNIFGQAGKTLESFIMQVGATSLDATLANIFGYNAGIINSFIWNKVWTFQVKDKIRAQFGRFLFLNIACLLFVFIDSLGFPYGIVWFVTMAAVTLINFISSKYWVFRENNRN
jgi:putative flippase GtrA